MDTNNALMNTEMLAHEDIHARNMMFESYILWFSQVVDVSIQLYFKQDCAFESIEDIKLPNESAFTEIIENELSFAEHVVLLLALMPHIRPQVLDVFFTENANLNRTFTEFGGLKGNTHGGFLPTGETASFILAGTDIEKRTNLLQLFDSDHFFAKQNILKIANPAEGEPFLSGALQVSAEFLAQLLSGEEQKPNYSISFPAKRITTALNWESLVLPYHVMEDIEDVNVWIAKSETIMKDWGLERIIKPGYRCLFYGPPGTGKTLTASLLGQHNNMDVYRIDLSMLVSKYIGETEKNLANVFDRAENKRWILFFDEADALFGKRTSTNTSNDRHANQEVAYLLQRVEDFPGIVILATNLKSNIDEAFARRFQSVIYFPLPDEEQRYELWQKMLPESWLANDFDLRKLANDYELSGGSMTNVVRYCALKLLANDEKQVSWQLMLEAVRKELYKEGKMS